ncbi:hypothetical protein BH11PSE3_BH11PSE3_48650 [soil metagenome]
MPSESPSPLSRPSPLELFFDHEHKVLLVEFSGVFDKSVTLRLNAAAKAVVEHHGHVAVILDFSGVTDFAIQLRDWPELGNSRRAIRGTPRVLVAPQKEIFANLHLHGTHYAAAGDGTTAVGSRAQAQHLLGLTDPKFEPLQLP